MEIQKFINSNYLTNAWWLRRLVPLLAIVAVGTANFFVFIIAPNEQVMGAVQRIFYFHVSSAIASYVMIAVLLVGSSFYLATKKIEWDLLASSGASVGFLLCSIVLISGMIWGHSAWNTWWRWEPRLVSFLLLWLILLSYILLRNFTEDHPRQKNFAAVLGIIAAVNVPIVIFSIKLLDHAEQLHPEVVARQGLKDVRFYYGLFVSFITMIIFSIWMLFLKVTNLTLYRECVLRRAGRM